MTAPNDPLSVLSAEERKTYQGACSDLYHHHEIDDDRGDALLAIIRELCRKVVLVREDHNRMHKSWTEMLMALEARNDRIAELEARKCSHGDYRMQGTTDCSNPECSGCGRTEFYVIGKGYCVACRHALEGKEKTG